MKKSIYSFKKLAVIFILFFAFILSLVGFNYATAVAEFSVPLNSGNHQKWIDRVDFSTAKYARDFYDWLVENSDGDGENDALIDGSLESYSVRVIEGATTYDVGASGSVEDKVRAAVAPIVEANKTESFAYISSAYYAFDRDYPQVFWLSGQISMGSQQSMGYDSAGNITYTQKITFSLKGDDYDIRSNEYVNGDFDIYEQITAVNNAVNEILSGLDVDATRYEKVEYFNDWITKNNAYANVIGDTNRDSRCALLGHDATSPYAPVCEGYARAFKVLCDRAEIPCTLVSGDAKGEAHMWALVQMENGEWYGVDVTWNDPKVDGVNDKISGYENHEYLLVGANTIVDGYAFKDSHVDKNVASQNGVEFLNQPEISLEKYGAPVKEKEWDVSSSGDGSMLASLYQAEGHTLLNPAYKLIISGNGNIKSFILPEIAPWSLYANNIEEIEIRSGVSTIYKNTFVGFTSLKKVVVLGDAFIEENTFKDCSSDFKFKTHHGYTLYDIALSLGMSVESICEPSEWEIVVEQSCEDDEELSATCPVCGFIDYKLGKLAHGHDYGNWSVKTAPTEQNGGIAQRVCEYDNAHVETYDLPNLESSEYVYSVKEPPKCTEGGKGVYDYDKSGVKVAVEVDISPLGHDFGAPVYEWEFALKKCVATVVCSRDETHVVTENGSVTASVENVDCETEGDVTFTATFTSDLFTTQTETTFLVAKGHEFSTEWTYSATEHWKECACGAKTDYAEHTYGEWVEKTPATVFAEGERTRSCECGHFQTETLQKLDFFKALMSGTLDKQTTNLLIAGGGILATIILLAIIIALIRKKPKKGKENKK